MRKVLLEPEPKHNELMSWAVDHRSFLLSMLILVCLVIILVSMLRDPIDYDSWWHLQMGSDLVEKGLSPYSDHYSFTYGGEKITAPPVLFQVGYYFLNDLFGDRGGQVAIKAIAFVSLFILFCAWLIRLNAPLSVIVLTLAVLITVIQIRVQVRPELLSFPMTIFAVMLYHRAAAQINASTMWPIVLLLLVWVNYHTPVLGYVVFFGLFVDVAIKLVRENGSRTDWLSWFLWGLLLVLIGFLNPQGTHFLVESLSFAPEWKDHISEFQTPVHYLGHKPTYLWILLAVVTLFLSLRQRRWGYLTIAGVLIYAALTMSRMVAPAMIVILAMFAHVLSEQFNAYKDQHAQPKLSLLFRGLAVVIGCIAIAYTILVARFFLAENTRKIGMFPEATMNYMANERITGNLFNVYQLGGFVLHRLSSAVKVYIDGRTGILYPLRHFERYKDARFSVTTFLEEVERYGIEYSLLPSSTATDRFMQDAGFDLEFADARYALYRRGHGRFALFGSISADGYCVSILENPGVPSEIAEGIRLLPEYAYVHALMALSHNYLHAEDPRRYLESVDIRRLVTDSSRRMYAALSLRHSLHTEGLAVLATIVDRERRDFMVEQFHYLSSNRLDQGSSSLRIELDFLRDWQTLSTEDLGLLLLILKTYKELGYENLVSPALLNGAELERMVEYSDVSFQSITNDPAILCPR